MPPRKPLIFTTWGTGRLRVLKNDVGVTATNPSAPVLDTPLNLKAVWDTGATGTVVTSAVVAQCGLVQTGMARVETANGAAVKPTYIIDLYLPNRVCVPGVRVTEGDLPADDDLLIGMDIIGEGDFVVTNFEGKTVFSFRMPSQGIIDFGVDQTYSTPEATNPPARGLGHPAPAVVAPRTSRNAKCPCGSGKKYKRCHGQAPTLS